MIFLDTNIVLYALGEDETKRQTARNLLISEPTISTQVINECSHVLRRKLRCSPQETAEHLLAIIALVNLVNVSFSEIRSAWQFSRTLSIQSL
jgi:predicted nucleic acid-binding protein